MRPFFSLVFGVALVALVLAGCGGSDDSTDTEGGSGSGAAAGKSGGDTDYSVGIVKFAAADETSSLAVAGFESKAAELGFEVTSIDPQGETDKAVAAMQTLVQKGVDEIVVTVFPSTSLTAGVIAAKQAGIPVISLSGGTADGVQANYDGGKPAGEVLAAQMMKETKGEGYLLALGYKLGLPCIGREEALDEAIAGTEFEQNQTREEVPIPGQVEASTRFTQAFLAKHPNEREKLTVWGCFDDPALGAIAAVKEAGRSGVKIYGMNGQPPAIRAIKDGELTATVWVDVKKAGEEMAEDTPGYIEAGVDAAPTDVPIPDQLVTADNVDQFIADHPQVLGAE